MKITGIETVLYEPVWDDPFAAKLRRVHGAITIRTDDGLTGISRTWGPQAQLIDDYLKPVLLGEDPRNVERLWTKMEQVTVPSPLPVSATVAPSEMDVKSVSAGGVVTHVMVGGVLSIFNVTLTDAS